MEYSVSVRVSPSSGEADHIETVPADGEEDAVMLREIIETHLRARRAGRRCPGSDWLHRMMLNRGCSCLCKQYVLEKFQCQALYESYRGLSGSGLGQLDMRTKCEKKLHELIKSQSY